ncbi:hypothetical protein AB3X52_04540 [Nocardioides sp. DS6]|uniref:Uncharacterized protein n=1 Tax=Nocardioides eburneus TaxID=3231482 RepID=A0ABV3SXZ3_9ACTN
MAGRLEVDPDALSLVARGIDETIAGLSGLGVLSEGEVGRGFGGLALTTMEAGHQGLAAAMADFCDRWGWDVRGLVVDANRAAAALDLSAGLYEHEDAALKGAITTAAALVSDPDTGGR